ncbi:G-protein coupled receptor 183-B [Carassius auratus]|uniref:G-protein coupled receptor 183-B n=1 Tax=Carassius auratus TaxID=7957 RepID=A0A6P6JKK4_CARAU|nr:G-protein coupled receptor 183-B-like [Carassius auratus]XP_052401609.1 G-protein coupled receptor 183-B [Carassius gibelio]
MDTDLDQNYSCTNLYDHRPVARVLIPLAYSIICPVGLLGNALALHVIFLNITKLNSITLYSANLAVSDILFCLSLPLRAVYYGLGFHWPMGEGLCKAITLLFYVNCYAGVNFMTCLAIDRFVALVFPMKLTKWRKVKNARLVCIAIWLLVLAQTLPLLTIRLTKKEHDNNITCMEYPNFEGLFKGLPFLLIIGVGIGFVVPLVTIIACYSILTRKLRLAAKSNRLTERSGRTKKARGVIAGVVFVFMVCFGPYHLDLLQYMIRKLIYDPDCKELQSFQISLHITVCLMNLNSCLDPFVYFFACKGYKQKLMRMMKWQVGTHFSSVGRTSHESSGTGDMRASRRNTGMTMNNVREAQ